MHRALLLLASFVVLACNGGSSGSGTESSAGTDSTGSATGSGTSSSGTGSTSGTMTGSSGAGTASGTTSGTSTTGGADECQASSDCDPGEVCAAMFAGSKGPLQCVPGCLENEDYDMWCADAAACCNGGASCNGQGLCVGGGGGSGGTSTSG